MDIKAYINSLDPKLFGADSIRVKIDDLPKGIWNHNYVAEINSSKFVFKIYSEAVPGLLFGNNATDEIKALKALSGMKIAPEPIHFEKSELLGKYVLIYKYVEGQQIQNFTNEDLKNLAIKMAKYHSLKPDNIPTKKESVKTVIRDCQSSLDKSKGPMVDEFKKFLQEGEEVDYEPGLVHGDLAPCNIIKNGGMRIIDWQRPHISDPAFDVWALAEDAFVLWDFDKPLTDSEKDVFIREYIGNTKDKGIMERVKKKSRLYYANIGAYCLLRWQEYNSGKIPKERTQGREHLWEKYRKVRDVCLSRLNRQKFI